MTDYDYTWKIMLLGDESISEIAQRYVSGYFLEDLKLTIGVDFYSKTTMIRDKKIKLQLWTYSGEERFKFLLHQYLKGANGAAIVYDITDRSSLKPIPDYLSTIRRNTNEIPIFLVGTNIDRERYRAVSREEGIETAKKNNFSFFSELSSKTGQNVDITFEGIAEFLLDYYETKKLPPPVFKLKSSHEEVFDFKYDFDGTKIKVKFVAEINEYIDELERVYREWLFKS